MKKTYKKIISMLALSTALFTTPVLASEPLNLNIFGESIVLKDAAPYLEEGRTVVPMRLISENLGFDVKWDGGTKEFAVKGVDVKDKEIVLIVGKMNESEVAVSKGGTVTKKTIDESPKVVVTMKNDRLYVPLRFFSESFSLDVKYDGASRTVFISLPGKDITHADTVWNGNVKDFLNALVEKTDMEMSKSGMNQVTLNKTQLMVTDGKDAPNGKGSKVDITATDWLYPNEFTPASMKDSLKKIVSTTKTTIEMFTADKTTFGKINQAIVNQKTTTINTSDGKKITINGEGGMIEIRLY